MCVFGLLYTHLWLSTSEHLCKGEGVKRMVCIVAYVRESG